MATLVTSDRGIQVFASGDKPVPGAGGDAIDDNFRDIVTWSPKNNWTATVDPGGGNDISEFYHPGSYWYNATAKRLFLCINNTSTAAVWHPLIPATGGKVVADTAGDPRGTGSVDLQTTRSANTQVASGTGAMLPGGSGNTASGANSFAGGDTSTASGIASVAIGSNCSASANYAHAVGRYATATHLSEFARASGRFSSTGDAQVSYFVARNETTNATQKELFLDSSSVQITIPSDSTCLFLCNIVARRTGGTVQSAAYQITGVIRNDGGSTALLGAITKTVIYEDAAAWDVTAVADNTNDALAIKVTGEASKTINWVADVQLVQVKT
jgi:hypothetical protein